MITNIDCCEYKIIEKNPFRETLFKIDVKFRKLYNMILFVIRVL